MAEFQLCSLRIGLHAWFGSPLLKQHCSWDPTYASQQKCVIPSKPYPSVCEHHSQLWGPWWSPQLKNVHSPPIPLDITTTKQEGRKKGPDKMLHFDTGSFLGIQSSLILFKINLGNVNRMIVIELVIASNLLWTSHKSFINLIQKKNEKKHRVLET